MFSLKAMTITFWAYEFSKVLWDYILTGTSFSTAMSYLTKDQSLLSSIVLSILKSNFECYFRKSTRLYWWLKQLFSNHHSSIEIEYRSQIVSLEFLNVSDWTRREERELKHNLTEFLYCMDIFRLYLREVKESFSSNIHQNKI